MSRDNHSNVDTDVSSAKIVAVLCEQGAAVVALC